ncbi:MAG: hypothetical protein JXL81_09090 [Deltaproteobacteria bacterium]|nr:hypothetical protein [Deltaproteobacteria bacterium]
MNENQMKLTDKEKPSFRDVNVSEFKDILLKNEEWLMKQILFYAKKQGYSKYTSTLMEAWRLSISGLSNTLISSVTPDIKDLELTPDEDYSIDPAASFGILEAKRHRERGVNLSMFLGLMKYYRQSYLDLMDTAGLSEQHKVTYKNITERFFDRIELGFCTEWCSLTESKKIEELQDKNRYITNEKNRYLTIFETIHAPVVLIDEKNRVENYNHAWTELFEESSVPGSIYYSEDSSFRKKIPWFVNEIVPSAGKDIDEYTSEKTLVTKKGPRHFLIKIKRMLDISDKYRGMVIILNDLTEIKKAEKERINKEKLEGVLEMAGAVCHEINQPLQVLLGQTEILDIESKNDSSLNKNLKMITDQIEKIALITQRLMNITKYETKPYIAGNIIDIEKSSQG